MLDQKRTLIKVQQKSSFIGKASKKRVAKTINKYRK